MPSQLSIDIIQTYEQLSGRHDKFLKIQGTDGCFLAIGEKKLKIMINFPDTKPLGHLKHPKNIEIRKEVGELEYSSNVNWLQISVPEKTLNYYENFLVDCLVRLQEDPRVTTIKKILRNWRKYWRFFSTSLTKEERIGLFGELLVLRHALEHINGFSWQNWQGSGSVSGLHDFQHERFKLEVKTSISDRDSGVIHVYNADQFQVVPNLSLCLVCLSEDHSGDNLLDLIEDITRIYRIRFDEDYEIIIQRLDHIRNLCHDYLDERYIPQSFHMKSIHPDGPFLQSSDFMRRPIFDISYKILISEINFDSQGGIDILSGLNSIF